ncbi:hypothetical protein AK830_g8912 [Neonectria ditissima]|uniref:Uncharacterized protein n=1 Tax=Neonectria ditissima TaxID=78410 RepID=A0A0P7AW61_9HYPO|nr:hypothetical protein AK830_g8912 [Neonectria ditissima]
MGPSPTTHSILPLTSNEHASSTLKSGAAVTGIPMLPRTGATVAVPLVAVTEPTALGVDDPGGSVCVVALDGSALVPARGIALVGLARGGDEAAVVGEDGGRDEAAAAAAVGIADLAELVRADGDFSIVAGGSDGRGS